MPSSAVEFLAHEHAKKVLEYIFDGRLQVYDSLGSLKELTQMMSPSAHPDQGLQCASSPIALTKPPPPLFPTVEQDRKMNKEEVESFKNEQAQILLKEREGHEPELKETKAESTRLREENELAKQAHSLVRQNQQTRGKHEDELKETKAELARLREGNRLAKEAHSLAKQNQQAMDAIFGTMGIEDGNQVRNAVRTRQGATLTVINPKVENRVETLEEVLMTHKEETVSRQEYEAVLARLNQIETRKRESMGTCALS